MFTKKEVTAYVDEKVAEDAKRPYPTEFAVRTGALEAFYSDTYNEYMKLAEAVKKLKDDLEPIGDSLPHKVRLALKYGAISSAIEHLKAVNNG